MTSMKSFDLVSGSVCVSGCLYADTEMKRARHAPLWHPGGSIQSSVLQISDRPVLPLSILPYRYISEDLTVMVLESTITATTHTTDVVS